MLLTLIKVVLSTLFRDILVACTEGGIESHGLSFFTQAFKARIFRNDSFKIVVQRHSTCSKSNGNNIRKGKKPSLINWIIVLPTEIRPSCVLP